MHNEQVRAVYLGQELPPSKRGDVHG